MRHIPNTNVLRRYIRRYFPDRGVAAEMSTADALLVAESPAQPGDVLVGDNAVVTRYCIIVADQGWWLASPQEVTENWPLPTCSLCGRAAGPFALTGSGNSAIPVCRYCFKEVIQE